MALFNVQPKKSPSKNKDNGNPFIQLGQYTDEELPIAELIQRRRLQMLIHSKIYYDMNTNLITDRQFDEWGRELVQLQRDNPNIAKRVCFAEAFKDWDANTGAFLPLQDPWVTRKAQQLLNIAGQKGVIDNIEYKKIQQSAGVKSSKKPKRKKATKQRGNALF